MMPYENIPTAREEHVPNPDQVPFAKQIFDTKKLYRRWAKCSEISLQIAHIGLQHATDLHGHATIGGAFGALFGSKTMQESAAHTSKHAHETAKASIVLAVAFLALSIVATTLYWAVEEGIIGTIVKSISAFGNFCINKLRDGANWIKDSTSGIFRRAKAAEHRSDVRVDLQRDLGIQEAIPVHMEEIPAVIFSNRQSQPTQKNPGATVCVAPDNPVGIVCPPPASPMKF